MDARLAHRDLAVGTKPVLSPQLRLIGAFLGPSFTKKGTTIQMINHRMARVDYSFCAAGNLLAPLVVFGITWAVAKWLLGDANPNWGTPSMWASGMVLFLVYTMTDEPPSSRPEDASHPNILPLTRTHLAIRMGAAALYTVIFGILLGVTAKPIMGPWPRFVVTAGLILFALNRYRTLYHAYCKDYVVYDPTAEPDPAPKTDPG